MPHYRLAGVVLCAFAGAIGASPAWARAAIGRRWCSAGGRSASRSRGPLLVTPGGSHIQGSNT